MAAVKDRVEELVSFIQERYLWQFHSRSWDREENINGILGQTFELLAGKHVHLETPEDKCFYADAKTLVSEVPNRFPWFNEMDEAQKKAVIDGTKERMLEIVVAKSMNGELRNQNY